VGFKPTVPASSRAKTVHALDRSATVTGEKSVYSFGNRTRFLCRPVCSLVAVPTELCKCNLALAAIITWLEIFGNRSSSSNYLLPHAPEYYVTTDGQSASLSWNKAPIWGLRPDFYYCQTVSGLVTWGALSDVRTSLPFTIVCWSSPAQSYSGPSPVGLVTIFYYCLRFETSLFVASYDSQGYGGGIRPRLHTGHASCPILLFLFYSPSICNREFA
jgi:hypothetical protein